jgi:HEPN domain-containing protein
LGFEAVRQNGSHVVLRSGSRGCVVPLQVAVVHLEPGLRWHIAEGGGGGLAWVIALGFHKLSSAGPITVADRSADWLEQALRDLEQADQSMQAGRHEWACFAAHQAVEKALKGLNLACGQQAWGHTLTRLWSALPTQDWLPPPPADLEDRLRLLDGFYIPTRYPDSYPEGTPGEHFGRLQSEQALLHAGVVTSWIRAALAQRR